VDVAGIEFIVDAEDGAGYEVNTQHHLQSRRGARAWNRGHAALGDGALQPILGDRLALTDPAPRISAVVPRFVFQGPDRRPSRTGAVHSGNESPTHTGGDILRREDIEAV